MEKDVRLATIYRTRKNRQLRKRPKAGAVGKQAQNGPTPEELLKRYLDFLVDHRGLGASSRRQNRKALTEFLDFLKREAVALAALCVADTDRFFVETAALGLGKVHLSIRSGAVRGFLRYLFAEGWHDEDLSDWVESPIIYREAKVPPHFTWEELKTLIASVKGDGVAALGDRSMLILLIVYGLRSSEVAALTLDDIDWKHAVLTIPHRKMGSRLTLPLVPVVAEILAQYLKNGRPKVAHRSLLCGVRGKPYRSGLDVTSRLHLLVTQAGLKSGRGAHAIRRAVGTRLVEQGLGLGEVACILGHANPDSGRVYLRLAMEFLRDVADNYGELL